MLRATDSVTTIYCGFDDFLVGFDNKFDNKISGHFLEEIFRKCPFFMQKNAQMTENSPLEQARRIRRKFLTYQHAEIVYDLSHKKIMEIANEAGAIYRRDGIVLINREIIDEYFERYHELPKADFKSKGDDDNVW